MAGLVNKGVVKAGLVNKRVVKKGVVNVGFGEILLYDKALIVHLILNEVKK